MLRHDLRGRRVVITGAARGIGALTARALHARGARVALLGIEPALLAGVAAECGAAPWRECDVRDLEQVQRAVDEVAGDLGGLDVAVANAGIAAQLPLLGGDPDVFEQTLAVNLLGAYHLVRAAGPHVAHPGGYVLLTASLAAAVHPPLLGAYAASKAGVEALGNSLRGELAPTGARVGVAYFSELDTDMTSRGFSTEAAKRTPLGGHGHLPVAPVGPAIDAVVEGIARRRRRVVSPRRVAVILRFRGVAQRVVDIVVRRGFARTLEIARAEHPPLTTEQPPRRG
ncbi:MAG TPA: SDR family NAD(P)-dependent oxidoreductase [Baekduia sp.]|nr:SDR family NAD(P)-dependent oxidoreductase [Baekduia sp.]